MNTDPLWYRDAVFYEVFVRSFADANGDGIGDLAGLTARLDYLQWLGVDAVWQLLGFFSVWRGSLGSGRALGCGEVVFSGQIRPFNRMVVYEVGVRRFTRLKESGASIVIGEGRVSVDGEEIAEIHGAKTGVFKGIAYPDYPRRSTNSMGGRLKR